MLIAAEPQRDNPPPSTHDTRKLVMALHELATLSQKMFGPSVTIESMHDPDDSQNRWMVFHVTASGDFAKRREQAEQWYEAATKILPESSAELRLSIMPRG